MANTHVGYIVRVEQLRPHPKADRLQIATFYHQDVIVSLETKIGDIGVFFPCDNQLGEEFCKVNKLLREDGGYMERSRAVKAIKLRGERSEGIYLPLSSLATFCNLGDIMVGDEVGKDFYGHDICHKYIPIHDNSWRSNTTKKKQGGIRKRERESYPEFAMHVDTQQLRYNLDKFHPGDDIEITLKLDGTSQRTAYTKEVKPLSWFRKLFHMKPKSEMKVVSGTRRTVISWDKEDSGFYGTQAFRLGSHLDIAEYIKPGMEVFYEVVGWYGPGQFDTIMAVRKTSKTGDKELVKRFGENMIFSYGCEPGENRIFIYRITEDNGRKEYSPEEIAAWCAENGFEKVPTVDRFIYTTEEDLLARIENYFKDIADPIDGKHIKEGVVVRIVNHTDDFDVYKDKTFAYRLLNSLPISEDMLKIRAQNLSEDVLEEG